MSAIIFDENEWLRSGAFLYRGKDTCTIGQGPFQNRTFEELTQSSELGWLRPSSFFSDPGESIGIYNSSGEIEKSALLSANSKGGQLPCLDWESPDFSDFESQFSEVQNLIEANQLEKTVAYNFEKAKVQLDTSDLIALTQNALAWSGPGYAFGYWDIEARQGCWGVTPELLFETDPEGHLRTMALAGTAKDSHHDLMKDPKEMSEHKLVVSQIQSDLKSFGAVKVGQTHVWQPSQLRHLKTDIEMEFDASKTLDMVTKLHPTPALGGYPKERAYDLLKSFDDKLPRFQFGAPFGFIGTGGRSCLIVQIRCLIWRDEELLLGSGCGIVADSRLEQEWNELNIKRNSVKAMFGLEQK